MADPTQKNPHAVVVQRLLCVIWWASQKKYKIRTKLFENEMIFMAPKLKKKSR